MLMVFGTEGQKYDYEDDNRIIKTGRLPDQLHLNRTG